MSYPSGVPKLGALDMDLKPLIIQIRNVSQIGDEEILESKMRGLETPLIPFPQRGEVEVAIP